MGLPIYKPTKLIKIVGELTKILPRGKGAIARVLGRVLRKQLHNTYFTTRYGAKLCIDSGNLDFYCTMHRWDNSWEHWVFDTAQWLVPDDGVFYDIGANVGYMSIEMLQRKPKAQVFSFEPIPELANIVDQSKRLNNFDNRSRTFETALSNTNEDATIIVPAHQGHASIAEKNHVKERGRRVHVKCRLLDDLIKEESLPLPDVIKIDVEGHELQVLQGSLKTIAGIQPHILFEVSDLKQLREIKQLLSDCAEYRYFYAIGSYRPLKELSENLKITDKIDIIAISLRHPNLNGSVSQKLN